MSITRSLGVVVERDHAEMVKEETLKDVNAFRAEWLLPPLSELPRGEVHNSRDCVIARALRELGNVSVTDTTIVTTGMNWADRKTYEVKSTKAMATFIKMFDEGRYPELTLH